MATSDQYMQAQIVLLRNALVAITEEKSLYALTNTRNIAHTALLEHDKMLSPSVAKKGSKTCRKKLTKKEKSK